MGKFGGLTAGKISGLLGCSLSTAKRELSRLDVTFPLWSLRGQEEAIGQLIYDYRFRKEIPAIMKATKNIKPLI